MKTGLGLFHSYRRIIGYVNLCRFFLRKILLGFDYANLLLSRIDKFSVPIILKYFGATIGENPDIEPGLVFHNCTDYRNLKIGNNCHIGKGCFFDLKERVDIGNNVVISMKCSLITHTDLGKSDLSAYYPFTSGPVIIGDNCYLGASTTILQGTKLAKNTLVSACSLIREDTEPYGIYAGIPARKKKTIPIKK